MAITFKESTILESTTTLKGRSPFKDGKTFSLVGRKCVEANNSDGTPVTREDGSVVRMWVLIARFAGSTKDHFLFPSMAFKEKAVDEGVATNGGTLLKLISDLSEDDRFATDEAVLDEVLRQVGAKQIKVSRHTHKAHAVDKQGREVPCVKSTLDLDILG